MGNIWDEIRAAFWLHKCDRTHVSKHRQTLTEAQTASRRVKRRAKNKAASKMRAIQRRRDRQSAKRQR